MTLPAFAAERRARMPAIGLCQSRSFAAATGQRDRRTDGHGRCTVTYTLLRIYYVAVSID